ncbi:MULTISPECIES: hypothetical protein [unclassified Sulfurimonas]|uniref:hypothetical protein n=1 Tax=unclassified Sulfurimonas TaxID=2623549 RepID=UPI0025D7FD18|nr:MULTISPECIES: hypothetical protein [unclassified Sulfurimonas]
MNNMTLIEKRLFNNATLKEKRLYMKVSRFLYLFNGLFVKPLNKISNILKETGMLD